MINKWKEWKYKKQACVGGLVFIVILLVVILICAFGKKGGKQVEIHEENTEAIMVETETEEVLVQTYDKAGRIEDTNSYEFGEIVADGVELTGTTFNTLSITDQVGEGTVKLDNVTVSDILNIFGGGENSVYISGNCKFGSVLVTKPNVHVVIDENAVIDTLTVYNSNNIEIKGTVNHIVVMTSLENIEPNENSGITIAETGKVGDLSLYDNVRVTAPNEDITVNIMDENVQFEGINANLKTEDSKNIESTEDDNSINKEEANSNTIKKEETGSSKPSNNNSSTSQSNSSNQVASSEEPVAPTPEPAPEAPAGPSDEELYPQLWEGQSMQSRKAHAKYDLYNLQYFTDGNGVTYYGYYSVPCINGPDLDSDRDCIYKVWEVYPDGSFVKTPTGDTETNVYFNGIACN